MQIFLLSFVLFIFDKAQSHLAGLIVGEIKSLWVDGIMEYVSDLWNIVDFIQNTFYVVWISLRITAWWIVQVDFIIFH